MDIKEAVFHRAIPLLRENFTHNVWGGHWIRQWKKIPPSSEPVGESWEFSLHPQHPNSVAMSEGESLSLLELVRQHPSEMLGHDKPFLLKFIDSNDNLSLQVHPGGQEKGKGSTDPSKSEAWYILNTRGEKDDGFIYLGFDPKKFEGYASLAEFEEAFLSALAQAQSVGPSSDPSQREKAARVVLPFLNKISVQPGDAFRVPPGTIHSIGRGIRLFEIQETSDATFRLWDWNRPGGRELHVQKAKNTMDYEAHPPSYYKLPRLSVPTSGEGAFREETVIKEERGSFNVNLLSLLEKGAVIQGCLNHRCSVLTIIKGDIELSVIGQRQQIFSPPEVYQEGYSIFLPAALAGYRIKALTSEASVLKSF